MQKWIKLFFTIVVLLSISGCAYGVSTSRVNYPYDHYPSNQERQWDKWFYGP